MISVIIPVYKKVDEFINNLDNNLKFLKGCEIIVVNDDPTASIKDRLEKYSVQLIENPKNLGFAVTIDKGIRKAKHNFVFLLNSDVKLLDDSYKTAVRKLEEFVPTQSRDPDAEAIGDKDKKIFGIAFAQKEGDGSIVGKNKIFWRNGLLTHSKADDLAEGETGWVEGGSSIIRKDFYEEIGGFDMIFSPFYWEDIELAYRARIHGYISWFDPNVMVEHRHESTIGSFWSRRAISVIATRNQLLCTWKNIKDTNVLQHISYVTYQVLLSVFRGNLIFAEAFIKAFPSLFSPKFYKIR